jgi:hypothetical protein
MKNVNITIVAILCNIFFNTQLVITTQVKFITAAVFKERHDGGDCGKGYTIHMEYTFGSDTPELIYDSSEHAYFLQMDMFKISSINSKYIKDEQGDHRYYDYIPINGKLKTAFILQNSEIPITCIGLSRSYKLEFNLHPFFCKSVAASYPQCYQAHSASTKYMFYSDDGKDMQSPNKPLDIPYFNGEGICGELE